MKKYVQYGCGLTAPKEWINYDVSPTLRLQKIPFIGSIVKLNTTFPQNVLFGDIIKGLPVEDNSCNGLYCSHTLEHLSLEDLRIALRNSYKILKNDGIFRCVLPDLEFAARLYLKELDAGDFNASMKFIANTTMLGVEKREKGLKALMVSIFGNSKHLWMWDSKSLSEELKQAGFRNIRNCSYNDCSDNMFSFVESEGRFTNALAMECYK